MEGTLVKTIVQRRQQNLFMPESDWTPPTSLPDLRDQPVIALDLETKDDGLSAGRGAGWAHGAGYVTGVAAAWQNKTLYAPIRSPDTECLDPETVGRWLKHLLKSETTQFVFHNGPYDLGWMATEWGLTPPANINDSMGMAYTLDENQPAYGLDAVCRWQGVPGKDERLLREAASALGLDAKSEMWRMPARYYGGYAEQDAGSTLGLYHSILPKLETQNLMPAYLLEMDLVPMVLEMRRRGIRIDMDKAEQNRVTLLARRDELLKRLKDHLGWRNQLTMKEMNSVSHKEMWFREHKIPFEKTPKTGRGSFSAEWMRNVDHWLPQTIVEIDQMHDAGDKFLKGFILDYCHRGRIHSEVHQYKDERGGTRTSRLSYSDPPLQQMPARNPLVRKAIRDCFLPEEGELWFSPDYSQQEYRLIVHFASICRVRGAQAAVDQYQRDPRTDYHDMVAEMTGLERKPAKDTNFAKAFGAGVPKFALMTGMTLDDAKATMRQYDEKLPYVSGLSDYCQGRANRVGYIRMLDGARMRFDKWEGGWIERDRWDEARRQGMKMTPCSLEEARERQVIPGHPWGEGRLRRADTRKAMNGLIQGSAARMTKMAMRDVWRAGYCPLIQMHDELGNSLSRERDGSRIVELMRDTVTLVVPVVVDDEWGITWGDAAATKDEPDRATFAAAMGRLRDAG